MSARIRQLEDALALLQSTMTNEPHPLLSRDLMKIKSSIDLHSAVDEQESDQPASAPEPDESPLDQFGTLAIRDDGGATFYGRSAGSEVRAIQPGGGHHKLIFPTNRAYLW